jgi:hypothetical protein
MNTNDYLADMGYAAYARITGATTSQGLPMPDFADLPQLQQAAWVNAAAAIRRRVVTWGMSAEEEPDGCDVPLADPTPDDALPAAAGGVKGDAP